MSANDGFNQYVSDLLSPNIVWFLMFLITWFILIINTFLIYHKSLFPEEDLEIKLPIWHPPVKISKPEPEEEEDVLAQFELIDPLIKNIGTEVSPEEKSRLAAMFGR